MAVPPGAFLVIAVVIGASGVNRGLFLGLNAAFAALGDVLWSHVTLFGDTLVVSSLLVFLLRRRPAAACAVYVAALAATPVIRIVKPALNVLRPPGILEPGTFHLIGPSFSQTAFPSGHTTSAFIFAGVVALTVVRAWWARACIIAVALVVGLSRVAVGIHWPLDVAAGATLGWSAAALGGIVARRTGWPRTPRQTRILAVPVILMAAVVTFVYTTEYEHAEIAQRLIGGVCLAWGIREFVMTWRDAGGVGAGGGA